MSLAIFLEFIHIEIVFSFIFFRQSTRIFSRCFYLPGYNSNRLHFHPTLSARFFAHATRIKMFATVYPGSQFVCLFSFQFFVHHKSWSAREPRYIQVVWIPPYRTQCHCTQASSCDFFSTALVLCFFRLNSLNSNETRARKEYIVYGCMYRETAILNH